MVTVVTDLRALLEGLTEAALVAAGDRVVAANDAARALLGASIEGTAVGQVISHPAAIEALEVGTVKVNAVFGGAPGGSADPRRDSGRGAGYGPDLLREMVVLKQKFRSFDRQTLEQLRSRLSSICTRKSPWM